MMLMLGKGSDDVGRLEIIFGIIVDVFFDSLKLPALNLFFDLEFFREASISPLGRRLLVCLNCGLKDTLSLFENTRKNPMIYKAHFFFEKGNEHATIKF